MHTYIFVCMHICMNIYWLKFYQQDIVGWAKAVHAATSWVSRLSQVYMYTFAYTPMFVDTEYMPHINACNAVCCGQYELQCVAIHAAPTSANRPFLAYTYLYIHIYACTFVCECVCWCASTYAHGYETWLHHINWHATHCNSHLTVMYCDLPVDSNRHLTDIPSTPHNTLQLTYWLQHTATLLTATDTYDWHATYMPPANGTDPNYNGILYGPF